MSNPTATAFNESATATAEVTETLAKSYGITPAYLATALQWAKRLQDARSNAGRIRARLSQVGESSLKLANKKTMLVEGVTLDITALSDSDMETLTDATRVIRAAEVLSKVPEKSSKPATKRKTK